MTKQEIDEASGVETTGHDWDGIKELNNPLPRWWLWTFYITIIWGIGYTIAYPAWPLINSATAGLMGYSTRSEVATEIQRFEQQNAELRTALANVDLEALADDDALQRFAVAGGASVFRTNCSQCHGSGAAGAIGYPNLLDDDWLWGGEIDQIAYAVRHGIRNETDPDALWSQMPAFEDILERQEIDQVAAFVSSLSGLDHEAEALQAGAILYAENCSACHGDKGEGIPELGAPNLTDAIWLYGSDPDDIESSIANARFGVMPAWGERLTDADINAVAAYVHQLGGGE